MQLVSCWWFGPDWVTLDWRLRANLGAGAARCVARLPQSDASLSVTTHAQMAHLRVVRSVSPATNHVSAAPHRVAPYQPWNGLVGRMCVPLFTNLIAWAFLGFSYWSSWRVVHIVILSHNLPLVNHIDQVNNITFSHLFAMLRFIMYTL